MRKAIVFSVFLAACELQPAPKQQPPTAAAPATPPPPTAAPPTATPPTPPPPAPAPPPGAGSAAGSAAAAPADPLAPKPALAVTQPCVDVGTHVAAILIAGQVDPSEKTRLEHDRTKLVRNTAVACTSQHWTPAAIRCFTRAKNPDALHACEAKFPPPGAQPPPPRPAPPPGTNRNGERRRPSGSPPGGPRR